MHPMEVSQVFESFPHLNIMVIGDVMVDAYLFGRVERISPEAPVPVVSVEKRLNRLGGAANVALNLKALGVNPVLCSVIGEDPKGEEFRQLLQEQGISPQGIVNSKERITTTKFRVIGNNTQMLRVDEEITGDLVKEDETKLIDLVSVALVNGKVDALIFQDYDKGVLTPRVIEKVIELSGKSGVPVVVDPKRKHFKLYAGVALFKPNLKEMREGLNMEIDPKREGALEQAADQLHNAMGIQRVMVTLSDAGIFMSERSRDGHNARYSLPAHRRSIADVSGAGDTVVSVAAACLAAGLGARDIAAVSNLAGGLVCEEVGVVPVNPVRLKEEIMRMKDD